MSWSSSQTSPSSLPVNPSPSLPANPSSSSLPVNPSRHFAAETENEDDAQNIWIFSDNAFIAQSPSRKQLNVSQELKIKEAIYDFVIRLGTVLKLSGGTILAATIYINRFYMRFPVTTSKYFVACAALAISCKLNDTYRPPDKLALSACILKHPHKRIDEHSDVFWQWRDQLLYREELMLKALNFELSVELPYSLRDHLLELGESVQAKASEHNCFYEKLKDVLRIVVSSIELFSSLPVLIAYDMKTFFGTMLVTTILDAREKFNLVKPVEINIPYKYISQHVGANALECLDCYRFIGKLLKYCDQKDSRLSSHQTLIKKYPRLDDGDFLQIANDESLMSPA